ncbi:MAG: transcription-repair coupling factor [Spirochaetes bacterium]|nr:transcription-repair coupling factor [Spirochaetota bacterium]
MDKFSINNSLINLFKDFDNLFQKLSFFDKEINIKNLTFHLLPILIKNLIKFNKNEKIIIVYNKKEDFYQLYNYFINFFDKECLDIFSSIPLYPYEFNKYDKLITYKRIKTLNNLIEEKINIVFTDILGFIYPVIKKEVLVEKKIYIRKGQKISQEKFLQKLISCGFNLVEEPQYYGEFSKKGEIFNIFYSPLENPVKIDFFDDICEFIKIYEKDSGKIIKEIDEINILPVKEFFINNKIDLLEEIGKNNLYDENLHFIIESISSGEDFASIWFTSDNNRSFLIDYFVNDFRVIFYNFNKIYDEFTAIFNLFDSIYNGEGIKSLTTKDKLILKIKKNYYSDRGRYIKIYNEIDENYQTINIKTFIDLETYFVESYENNFEKFNFDKSILSKKNYEIYISGNDEQIKKCKLIFKDDFINYIKLEIKKGFKNEIIKKVLFSYGDIIQERFKIKSGEKAEVKQIEDYLDIKPGDYIVHIKYGIGLYKGIKSILIEDNYKDFISIEYKNGEELNVPIDKIGFLQKYIAFGDYKPKLDSLSGKTWKKTVEETKKNIYEFALKLFDIYEKRKKEKGISFLPDNDEMKKFEDEFEFVETYDQLKTIDEVKKDMEASYPMDRLVCGDVGFGKTEIAMRAAFKAVYSGYQVLFLCPTTVLANQHFEVFSKRFRNYPVNIGIISRLVSKEEQNKIIKDIRNGNVDILIGTHRALSKDIQFKNLGLLIIDEEQKFGVEHKEKIKMMKYNIDVLSLSATPIPRTLYLSLIKLRPVSVINTPPENRKPVKVFISKFSDEVIKNAIKNELEREGKVYIIHNRISTIAVFTSYVNSLFDNKLSITYIHARMEKSEIKNKIRNFINGLYRVLVATTIIESGIDIPDVNTIIIDEAEKFGLSTLYQLKGRVGRREKEAFAYLLYKNDLVNSIGIKRLEIIEEYAELGSGYKIAIKDLELRGYGDILGKEQSGFISRVGFQMYKLLLEQVTNSIENKEKKDIKKCEVEIDTGGYVPENYICDKEKRFEVYQRLYFIDKQEDLIDYMQELQKNYGPIPDNLANLFLLNEIRILGQDKRIDKIWEDKENIIFFINESSKLNLSLLVKKIEKGEIIIDKKNKNIFKIKNIFISFEEKCKYLKDLINQIFEL